MIATLATDAEGLPMLRLTAETPAEQHALSVLTERGLAIGGYSLHGRGVERVTLVAGGLTLGDRIRAEASA